MTADDEIRNIRWTLGKIHQALRRMDNEFEKALPEINHLSAALEKIITDIANEANNICNTTVKIVSNVSFPDLSLIYAMIYYYIIILLN